MKIVIFCGGYGTRMWPVSRKSYPKQFAPLVKGKSFFQLTVSRFKKVFSPEDILVSTEEKYIPFIRRQAPEIPRTNIIAEPERKDNLAAVGLATAIVHKRFANEVMLVSWSDHFISKEMTFLDAVLAAGEYAENKDLIVSVDEKPSYPSIHNGWVKLGKTLGKINGYKIVQIIRHVEKPNISLAKKLYNSGCWLINTGYRAWRTDIMLSYYKEYVPEMYNGLLKIWESFATPSWERVLKTEYHKFQKDSVEYGIFEKLPKDKRATIPVKMGWEDAGTWELFYNALVTPKKRTVVEGGVDTENIDSDNNLIIGQSGKIISVIGLTDIVIVDTSDALLVSKISSTDKVKEVFKRLEKNKKEYVE